MGTLRSTYVARYMNDFSFERVSFFARLFSAHLDLMYAAPATLIGHRRPLDNKLPTPMHEQAYPTVTWTEPTRPTLTRASASQ